MGVLQAQLSPLWLMTGWAVGIMVHGARLQCVDSAMKCQPVKGAIVCVPRECNCLIFCQNAAVRLPDGVAAGISPSLE